MAQPPADRTLRGDRFDLALLEPHEQMLAETLT